jgi:hypothetical protein
VAILPSDSGAGVVWLVSGGSVYHSGWHDGIWRCFTAGIPLMGVYYQPWAYIWKDGVIKDFLKMDLQDPGDPCNAEWWQAITISSGLSGMPVYNHPNTCGDGSIVPYAGAPAGSSIK